MIQCSKIQSMYGIRMHASFANPEHNESQQKDQIDGKFWSVDGDSKLGRY